MKKRIALFAGIVLSAVSNYAASPMVISKVDLARLQIRAVGRVASATPNQLLVKAADGSTLQGASAPGSQASLINAGQLVWITPTQLFFVSFPIELSRSDDVAVGHMKTDLKLSNTGILRGQTHTWTNNNVQGFTGGVLAVLMSKDGNDLYVTQLHKYGVNGTNVPGASSSRNDVWTENISKDLVNQTAKIAIVQMNAGTNRIDDFLAHAKQVAEIAKTVSEAYSNFAGGPGTSGPTSTTGSVPPGK